jgi:hypothetical protein
MADEEKNRQLGDLVTAELTGAKGFDLIEPESLARILEEQHLNWSGLVRAKDALRIGKLLKAEWFLLGTEARIGETNCLVARVVDARTGIIRDAGVFPADTSSRQLATDLGEFLRQVRQNAANARMHTYLAIGAFEDLSVNNRRADFPSQLRGYLTAAYRGGSVTLLERQSVDTLLREMHLDLAGLTDDSEQGPPEPMQSAFWLVTGQYQSYETTNFQVEVNLEVHRAFGTLWEKSVHGAAGNPIGQLVKQAIDEVMNQKDQVVIPTRRTEARIELRIGRELTRWQGWGPGNDFDFITVGSNWYGDIPTDPQTTAKQKRRLTEAIHTFETVLLLEPNNHEAKMYLAALMRNQLNLHPDVACQYYREVINDPVRDKWTEVAQRALVETFLWFGPDERLHWLKSAVDETTNETAAAFYRNQIEVAADDATISEGGNNPKAEEIARQRLLKSIRLADDFFHNKVGAICYDHLGMSGFVAMAGGGTNAARKLAALLPEMINAAPDLKPFIITSALSFQPDTNTPLLAEFRTVLTNSIEHPQPDLNPGQLWCDIGQIYYWCLDTTNDSLAVEVLEAQRRAAAAGYSDFGDEQNIKLAYAYLALSRWKEALNIFECYSNRPVPMGNWGPWGAAFQPIMTDKLVAFCREKLGRTARVDPREFPIGKPVLRLGTPAVFVADDTGLWFGVNDALFHLNFDLETNLQVLVSMRGSPPVTALCLTTANIWVGTAGGGLIQVDKASHKFRRFTVEDGLLMDGVFSLASAQNSLWIGYGSASGGGLGVMDLRSLKLGSFMPSLIYTPSSNAGELPPHGGIGNLIASPDGYLWMLTGGGTRRLDELHGRFETVPIPSLDWASCFARDSDHFVEGGGIKLSEIEVSSQPYIHAAANLTKIEKLTVSSEELRQLAEDFKTNSNYRRITSISGGNVRPRSALVLQDLRNQQWETFEDPDALPNPVTTLTLAGNELWVGCEGAIALVDLKQRRARKYCHLHVGGVNRIQIAGGYVWALCDGFLYRAPLSAWQ